MATMGRTGIKRLSLKKDTFELMLEREEGRLKSSDSSSDLLDESNRRLVDWNRADGSLPKSTDTSLSSSMGAPLSIAKEDDKQLYITSPMVGTFYTTPSPEDPPFVKVGDRVEKNTVVCVIEAMKVTNEIKANICGTITEVCMESAHPVEFGSKLFRISE